LQANGLKPAFAPPHPDAVAIGTDEIHLLAPEIDPSVAIAIAIPPLGLRVGGNEPGADKGDSYRGKTPHVSPPGGGWLMQERDETPESVIGSACDDAAKAKKAAFGRPSAYPPCEDCRCRPTAGLRRRPSHGP
jgi:hypothetical protein